MIIKNTGSTCFLFNIYKRINLIKQLNSLRETVDKEFYFWHYLHFTL